MIKYIQGDLLENSLKNKMLVHVVNDQNSMGSGVALAISNKYPVVKSQYHNWFTNVIATPAVMGMIQAVLVDEGFVINMMAQDFRDGRRVRYDKLVHCMNKVVSWYELNEVTEIICPLFGAGLAGGSWEVVHELIMDIWVDNGIPVSVYYLPKDVDKVSQFLPSERS